MGHDCKPMTTDTSIDPERVRGRSISTVRLQPAVTEVPLAGDPITTFCATAVVIRRKIEETTLKSFIVLGVETIDSELL